MKKITLACFTLFALTMTAQTTHNINWFVGAAPGTVIVEAGDTVNWMWTDGLPHSVTSDVGSTDTWDSGILPNGSTFQRVFPNVGTNPYFCSVHPSMQGVIEVEPALGIEDENTVAFQYYPNPVKDFLFIDSNDTIDTVQLFDVNGRLLMNAPVGNKKTTVYMGVFKSGMYFVTVRSGAGVKSFQVVLDK